MPLRPARCYTQQKKPAYTRKEYIQGVPPPKITKYTMGNPKGEYKYAVKLIATTRCVIRHNALEAARIAAHRYLSTTVGEDNFFLVVKKYPHHVLRENKMLAFAGADRLQDGMRLAFGKPIGTAAITMPGDDVMVVYVSNEKHIEAAKEALSRAETKLPEAYRIEVVKLY
ncbi:MAG: 50S ribosomal protein L16 [Desulfurococcaceae archaeon]|jgi:large subunit ribosomal protein L10e|nr:MAG: 50S ribosomal protein L16 [Desulfurococcaceae archaeon]